MSRRLRKDILIKLLRRYSEYSFDHDQLCAFEMDERGFQHAASVKQCCNEAAEQLDAIRLEDLKFRALVEGMKRYGLDDIYQRIMREPISEALK